MADIGTKDGAAITPLRLTGVAANATCTIPAGYQILAIGIKNTTANAVTGGIKVGTTNGGVDVILSLAIGANANIAVAAATILLGLWAADQQLFIQTLSAWNSASLNITFHLAKL